MNNNFSTDDLNEELPNEYEVIQRSLRNYPDKQQQDGAQRPQATPGKKQESPRGDNTASPSNETAP